MKSYGYAGMMDIKPTINPHIPVSATAQVSPSGGSGIEAWEGRSIAGPKLRLCDFSAFLEQQRDSETVREMESKRLYFQTCVTYAIAISILVLFFLV